MIRENQQEQNFFGMLKIAVKILKILIKYVGRWAEMYYQSWHSREVRIFRYYKAQVVGITINTFLMFILNVRSLSRYLVIDKRILRNNAVGFTEAHKTVSTWISATIKYMFLRLNYRYQVHFRNATKTWSWWPNDEKSHQKMFEIGSSV